MDMLRDDFLALHLLFSQVGRLVFYTVGHISIGLAEPYREPAPIHIPYSDNNTRRWDSAEKVLSVLD